jgi:hypothetical protein
MLSAWLFKKHLEDDETLKRAVHKHWLLGFRALFWPTLWILACALILWINHARGMITVFGILEFVLCIWWLRNFFDYFLDAWLVTDHGIIDIAWHGWFHRESSRILYSDLQGVSYEIEGVWGTLLRYGTISVEKISTGTAVSLESVSQPKKIEILILQCMEQYLHKKNLKDSKQVQEMLATLIAERIQLNEMKNHSDDDDE